MGPDILKMDNVLIFVIFFVIFNTSSCVPLLSEMTGSGPNPPPPKRTVAKVPIQEPSLLTKSQVKAGMRKNLLGPGAAPPVKEQQVLNKAGPAPDMRIPMDNPLLGAQIDAMLAEASLQGLDPTNIFQNPAFGMQLDNMLKNMPMAPKRKVAKLPVQDPSTLTRSQVKAGLRKNLLASGDVPVEPVVKKQHTLNKAGTSSDLSTSMDNPFIGAQLDAMLSQASMPGFDPTSALQSPAFGEQFDKMLRSLPMGQLASLDFLNSPLSKIMSGNVQTPMAIHSHPAEISVKPLDRARLSPGSSSKPKVLPTQSSKDGGIFALEPTGQKIGHINPGTTIKQMDVKTNPKSMPELHTGPRSDSIIAAEKGKKVPAQITKSEVKQVNTEQYTKTRNTEQVMKTMPVLNIAPGVKDVNKIKPVQGLKPGTDQISSVDLKPTEIKNSLKPKTSGIDNMPLFSQEAGIYPNTMAKKSGAFSTNRAFPGSQQVDQMHFRTGDVNKHDISPLIHTDFSKGTVHSHANILQTPMQSGSKGAFSYVQHPLPDMSKQPKMYKSPTLKNKVGAASGEMIQPIKQPEVAGSLTPKNKVGAVFGEMIPPVKQPKVAKSLTPKNDARAVLGEIIQSVKQPKEVKSSMTKNNIDTVLDEMVKLVKPPSLPPGLDTPMSKIPEAPMLPLPDTVHVNIEPSLPGVSWANVGDGITRNKPPMDTSYSSMQKSQQPSVKKSILKKPKPCRLKGLYATCNMMGNPSEPQYRNITGVLYLRQTVKKNCKYDWLNIQVDVSNVPMNDGTLFHGMHIHQYGEITEGCDGMGPHYNPSNTPHGAPWQPQRLRHVGDLGNVRQRRRDGKIYTRIVDYVAKLFGRRSIIGRGIVHQHATAAIQQSKSFQNCRISMAISSQEAVEASMMNTYFTDKRDTAGSLVPQLNMLNGDK